MKKLDKRATEALKEIKKHVPERKERIEWSSLNSLPPMDAPKWTVDRDWLKGDYINPTLLALSHGSHSKTVGLTPVSLLLSNCLLQ